MINNECVLFVSDIVGEVFSQLEQIGVHDQYLPGKNVFRIDMCVRKPAAN